MGELSAVPKPAEAESERLPAAVAEREAGPDLSWFGHAVATFGPAGGPPWVGPALTPAPVLTLHANAAISIDVLETREAIARYEAAAAQLRTLSGRIERISRELDRLRPLLQYPAQANALIGALRTQADTLRENGQVVLAQAGQL